MPDEASTPTPQTLPYWTEIRPRIFDIATTIVNRVDRDLRAQLEARATGLRMWLRTHVLVARYTLETLETLALKREEMALPLDIAVVMPSLARGILESMLSVMYIFEDPETRLKTFWKSSWREMTEQIANYRTKDLTDANWQRWLTQLEQQRDLWLMQLDEFGAAPTSAEQANPRLIGYWPNPGKFAGLVQDAERKRVMEYFKIEHYRELSAAAHMSGTGLFMQGGILIDNTNDNDKRRYFSNNLIDTLTLIASLLSQCALDVIKEPALALRLLDAWKPLLVNGTAAEAYTTCFEKPLKTLARIPPDPSPAPTPPPA